MFLTAQSVSSLDTTCAVQRIKGYLEKKMLATLTLCIFLVSSFGYSEINAQKVPNQFSRVTGTWGTVGNIFNIVSRYQNGRLIQHPASGKCMNIERALIGSGIKIIMYDCNWRGAFVPVNELFYAIDAGNGGYMFKGSASHSNMCLYTGNNYNDPLYTIGCKKDDNRQQFEFRQVGHEEYLLVQKSTGRCLRAEGRGNGATIRSVNCDNNDSEQKWRICNGDAKCD